MMQVWDNQGEMVFERQLDKPVANWNISTNKFMFHESEDSDIIHVVHLRKNAHAVMFELKLPEQTQENFENKELADQGFPMQDVSIQNEDPTKTLLHD